VRAGVQRVIAQSTSTLPVKLASLTPRRIYQPNLHSLGPARGGNLTPRSKSLDLKYTLTCTAVGLRHRRPQQRHKNSRDFQLLNCSTPSNSALVAMHNPSPAISGRTAEFRSECFFFPSKMTHLPVEPHTLHAIGYLCVFPRNFDVRLSRLRPVFLVFGLLSPCSPRKSNPVDHSRRTPTCNSSSDTTRSSCRMLQMILAAYCLGEEAKSGIDHVDVPPIMIDVPGGGGYDFVRRKIVEGLQGYRGKHEAIYVKTASCFHGALTLPSAFNW